MTKIWSVARLEMRYFLGRVSFYVSNLFGLVMVTLLAFLPEAGSALSTTDLAHSINPNHLDVPTGLVDLAGIVNDIPEEMEENLFLLADEVAAADAITSGEIRSYYVIPAGYTRQSDITEYSPYPEQIGQADEHIRRLIQENLLQQLDDPYLLDRWQGLASIHHNGAAPALVPFLTALPPLSRIITAVMVFSVFSSISNSNGYLLVQALRRESHYRLLEVLITSLTPWQLVGGKLLGITLIGLLEIVPYFLILGLVYQRDSAFVPYAIPLPLLPVFLIFLVMGYLGMSGLMLSAAAAFPQQGIGMFVQFLFRLLNLVPVGGGIAVIFFPDHPATVFLSLFPLTSHILMPFRLIITTVPTWQLILGVMTVSLWAFTSFWFSTRLFRAYSLLTGQRLSWQALKLVFRG